MCGRYALNTPEKIAARFHVNDAMQPLLPQTNVAPSQTMPVVAVDSVRLMRWGYIPSFWSKPFAELQRLSTFNARAESLLSRAFYKKAVASRRCIIPASSFYEWQKIYAEGADPASAKPIKRVPYEIGVASSDIFGFAGLYDTWRAPDRQEIASYTIITTAPNELMEPIHNRMPAILLPEDEEMWLNPDETEPERVLPLLRSYPANMMYANVTNRNLHVKRAASMVSH
jgi:putative SOS response-associated peptidase YedK